MSSGQPAKITEEWAKNPDAAIFVRCDQCQVAHALEEILKEETWPPPHENISEVLRVCPECGYRKHVYYISPKMREQQKELKAALERWNFTHISADFEAYRKAQNRYQKEFDKTQEFVSLLAKAGN